MDSTELNQLIADASVSTPEENVPSVPEAEEILLKEDVPSLPDPTADVTESAEIADPVDEYGCREEVPDPRFIEATADDFYADLPNITDGSGCAEEIPEPILDAPRTFTVANQAYSTNSETVRTLGLRPGQILPTSPYNLSEMLSSLFTSPVQYDNDARDTYDYVCSKSFDNYSAPSQKFSYTESPYKQTETVVKPGLIERLFGAEIKPETNLIHDPFGPYGQIGTYVIVTVEVPIPLMLPAWETAFTNAHFYSGYQFDKIIFPWTEERTGWTGKAFGGKLGKCLNRINYSRRPSHFKTLKAVFELRGGDPSKRAVTKEMKQTIQEKIQSSLIISNVPFNRPTLKVVDVNVKLVTEMDIIKLKNAKEAAYQASKVKKNQEAQAADETAPSPICSRNAQ